MSDFSQTGSLLDSITVGQLIPDDQDVLSLLSTDQPPVIFQKLVERNLHSAPVWDVESKKYLGFIHLLDILTFLTQIYSQNNLEDDLYNFLEKDAEFTLANSKAIIDLSHKNPFIQVSDNTPVRQAISHFLSTGIHRMAVVPSKPKSDRDIRILTRAMVFQWLTQRIRKLSVTKEHDPKEGTRRGTLRFISEQLWSKKLSALPTLGTTPVVTISADKPCIEALSLMTKHRVSSLAVLSPSDGKLLTHISATDIKVLVKEVLFTKIYSPVRVFIMASRAQETNEFPPAIYSLESDTFGHLVELFQATKIHRLFIVDSNTVPSRAVSLTDIMKVIMSHLEI